MSSGEITGEHFQSLEYLVQKCGTFSNLADEPVWPRGKALGW